MRLFGLAVLSHIAFVSAIVPNVINSNNNNGPQQPRTDDDALNSDMSLPNLLHIQSIGDIKNYDISGNVQYDSGRLLISQYGSLWTRSLFPRESEFTVEVVFRSSGTGEDIMFSDNHLTFWVVESRTTPENYDGFKFVVNNRDTQGLKIFNNDGTSSGSGSDESLSLSIGDCQFRYLQSDVPFTLRISYTDKWFKVQVDNNLCFKTDQVQIPVTHGGYKFGISSFMNPQSSETFEILAVKVWDGITEDAIDDHGLMADGQLKIDVTEKQVAVEQQQQQQDQEQDTGPDAARRKFLEKVQQQQQQHQQNEPRISSAKPSHDMVQVVAKIENLEHLIADLSKSIVPNTNIDEVTDVVKQTQLTLLELKQTFIQQYSELLTAIASLNQKVIGEVREQHYGMEELSRKVDLLMNEHKQVQHQYQKQQHHQQRKDLELERQRNGNNLDGSSGSGSVADSLIKWILVPLVVILLALLVFVYRLRHDIKHSKLL
ncbi:uncharacterized protein LODBEIA_P16850 [Lodderomyces beijingensis]|uniref:L-type lectin-like domain-containing protein n=1 Tax=Lodderomyces beijingensis TaxID=1775926 RepID=A0ABP0ZJZ9_9ASCO